MIEQLLEQAKHQWLNIGSVIFLLILIPIRGWIRNIALEKIKKRFDEDEYIVYEPSFPFMVEFFAPFLFGGMTLELIVSHNNSFIVLSARIFLLLILYLYVFFPICIKYLITNKKIYAVPTFDFYYKLNNLFNLIKIKFFEINILDINNITIEHSWNGEVALKIKTKTEEDFPRLFLDKVNEIKSQIDNQIVISNN